MQCGCRQRKGPEACLNSTLLREDKLLASLQLACSMVFDNIDEMVEAALTEAKQSANTNREDANRIRAELSKLDTEIGRVMNLLADPDLLAEPLAKKAILRKASELEAKREELHSRQVKLVDKASDDTEVLAGRIRSKLEAARDQWSALAGPAHLNALIGEFVGPSMVTAEGRLLPARPTENPVPGSNPLCTG